MYRGVVSWLWYVGGGQPRNCGMFAPRADTVGPLTLISSLCRLIPGSLLCFHSIMYRCIMSWGLFGAQQLGPNRPSRKRPSLKFRGCWFTGICTAEDPPTRNSSEETCVYLPVSIFAVLVCGELLQIQSCGNAWIYSRVNPDHGSDTCTCTACILVEPRFRTYA